MSPTNSNKKNKSPERNIQDEIEHSLYYYQSKGVVIGYIDISKLGKRYLPWLGIYVNAKSDGEPDLVIWVRHEVRLWTLLVEVKNPVKYVWGKKQKEFKGKFDGLDNVFYLMAFSALDVTSLIENITSYSKKQLEQMGKDMGL